MTRGEGCPPVPDDTGITHMKAFSLALESMGKPAFGIGRIAPTPGLVNQFFNDSTGSGDHGEIDTRGPWNEGNDWVFTPSPPLNGIAGAAPSIVAESSPPDNVAGLDELLIGQLRDILHADKQLTKALPKMAEATRFDQLRELFEVHLGETEAQVERINECFELLALLWQILPVDRRELDSQITFSMIHRWSAFVRADHGGHDVEVGR